jgi:hypothetical protein
MWDPLYTGNVTAGKHRRIYRQIRTERARSPRDCNALTSNKTAFCGCAALGSLRGLSMEGVAAAASQTALDSKILVGIYRVWGWLRMWPSACGLRDGSIARAEGDRYHVRLSRRPALAHRRK